MNGINLTAVSPLADEEFYPSSDGQPLAETQVHVLLMIDVFSMLRWCFRKKQDIYVAANMFLYYREGHLEARTAPDIMAIKGVDGRKRRRSFKTWEEKAVPCFTLELTSKKTAKEDQGRKKQLYQELRVREYFLFDPLDDYLPKQLLGYRLTNGKYKPIKEEEQGALVSEELGLRFIPDHAELAVVDLRTGERLLAPAEAEAYETLEAANEKVEEAKEKTSQMESALARECRKNAELAAELKRLKRKKK